MNLKYDGESYIIPTKLVNKIYNQAIDDCLAACNADIQSYTEFVEDVRLAEDKKLNDYARRALFVLGYDLEQLRKRNNETK